MPPRLSTKQVQATIAEMENGEYALVSEYISSKDPITVRHKCGNETTVKAKGFLQEGSGRCKICHPVQNNRNLTPVTEDVFVERVAAELGDEYTYLGGFTRYKDKVSMRHEACGHVWDITPHMLLGGKKRRCPNCANDSRGSHLRSDTYLDDVLASQPDGNEYRWIGQYNFDNKEKIEIEHVKCKRTYFVRPNDFQQGYRCPECYLDESSKAVKYIADELTRLGIPFKRETTYEGMVHISSLRFDFDIDLGDDHRLIIEHDGAFHDSDMHLLSEKEIDDRKKRDRVKDKFCEEHDNLHLHRISYKEDVRVKLREILDIYFILN